MESIKAVKYVSGYNTKGNPRPVYCVRVKFYRHLTFSLSALAAIVPFISRMCVALELNLMSCLHGFVIVILHSRALPTLTQFSSHSLPHSRCTSSGCFGFTLLKALDKFVVIEFVHLAPN